MFLHAIAILALSAHTGLVKREGDDDHDDHHDDHHGDHESLGPCACLGSRLKLDCSDIDAIDAAEAMLKSVLCTDEEAEHVCDDHKECADAFLVIQAHHDLCPTDTMTKAQEQLFHDFEDGCAGCDISRPYNADLNKCSTVDCDNSQLADLMLQTLENDCPDGTNCCNTNNTQAAYTIIYSMHAVCDHDDVPESVEKGIHEFEEACHDVSCNTVGPEYDPYVCPSSSSSDLSDGAIAGIVIAGVVVGVALLALLARHAYSRGVKYGSLNTQVVGNGF